MHSNTLLSLAAGLATARAAASIGFNYGNTVAGGGWATTADYEAQFKRAQTLQGTNGEFTSARIYTMVQGGTTDTVTEAIQAAINTGTTLLLGLWTSADQSYFDTEISALKSAISQYGSDFTDLVVGLSVGSEDLYRITPTGIENEAGIGQEPDVLVSYIKQTREAIAGTGLSGVPIGHVDTWTAWVNGSNFEVTSNCDWLGVDSYPYYQKTVANSIDNANGTFWDSYDATVGASQGKPVWVTETGWPVSGAESGLAIASTQNAETYWQEVGCTLLNGGYNTWWYILQDAPSAPEVSFGLVGENLDSAPLYDLTCKKVTSTKTKGSSSLSSTSTTSLQERPAGSQSSTAAGSAPAAASSSGAAYTHTGPGPVVSGTGSKSSSAPAAASSQAGTSDNAGTTPRVGAAAGAGVVAILGLVAAL